MQPDQQMSSLAGAAIGDRRQPDQIESSLVGQSGEMVEKEKQEKQVDSIDQIPQGSGTRPQASQELSGNQIVDKEDINRIEKVEADPKSFQKEIKEDENDMIMTDSIIQNLIESESPKQQSLEQEDSSPLKSSLIDDEAMAEKGHQADSVIQKPNSSPLRDFLSSRPQIQK